MTNYRFLKEWNEVQIHDVLSEEQLLARGLTLKDIDGGVDDKTIELVPAEATPESLAEQDQQDAEVRAQEEAEAAAIAAALTVEPLHTYKGKIVTYDGMRTVNEKQYRHIRTADGATYDLTEEEYQAVVQSK